MQSLRLLRKGCPKFASLNFDQLSATQKFLHKNQALLLPAFRNLLVVRFTLILALQMQAAVVSYFVYRLTIDEHTGKGDPVVLGLIGLWEVIPAISFSLFSGHVIDTSRKKVLLGQCLVGYFIVAVFFVFLSYPGLQQHVPRRTIIMLVYSGIFVGGALRAFLSPALFALLGLLVPKNLYPNATTWSSASWQIGAVAGPLVGGFMIAIIGFQKSLMIGAVLVLISFFALTRVPAQPVSKKDKEPVLQSLATGIRFVFGKQIILAVLSLDMFAVLFGGAVALLPVYADDILKVGEVGFGWLRAAPAIGAVLTLAILSVAPVRKRHGVKLLLCFIGYGLSVIVFGYCGVLGGNTVLTTVMGLKLSWGFIIAFSMLILGGMFDSVNIVIRHTILQIFTPDEMRGRVAAVNTIFISSSNELGAMESGLTAKWMGTVPAVVFGGIMCIAVVGITWVVAPMLRMFGIQQNDLNETESKTA